MPSLVLAIRLVRPFTLMFSRSLRSQNIRPNFCIFCMPVPDGDIQYVQHIFSSAQSAILPLWQSQFKHVGYRGCVACYQLHRHFNLLPNKCLKVFCSTWHRCTHQGRWLATTLQVLTPFQVLLSQWLLMTSLPTSKRMPTILSEVTALIPSLASLSASLFPGIPWCPGINSTVILLDPFSFSSACILSHTWADSAGFFCKCCFPTIAAIAIRAK